MNLQYGCDVLPRDVLVGPLKLLFSRWETYAAIRKICNYTFVEIDYPLGAIVRKVTH